MSGRPLIDVFYGGPTLFTSRAAWVLDTLLAPLGRRARLVSEREAAGGCALAYDAAPVPDVPTIPCDAGAIEAFAVGHRLPHRVFSARTSAAGTAVGAFPAPAAAGFAVPFDLVTSAFALLACWDERVSEERDRFGRLPFSASLFATNPALRVEEPAVDGYLPLLRAALAPRLAALGLPPLPPAGWMWGDGTGGGPRFAVALTHDVDNLWRWTPRGFAATGYRSLRALRDGRFDAFFKELGDLYEWATVHLPRHTDPFWTFPQLLGGEDMRGVSSTFFVIARHTHRRDGNQPGTYQRRIGRALELLRTCDREVGLHGNHADRLGPEELRRDRDDLAARCGSEVDGVRYHYLRCLYHETLRYADEAGFAYDSSLAFAEHEGFRCGTSYPFHPYDLDAERPLGLLEVPLAVMDSSLLEPQYRKLDADAAEAATRGVLDRVAAAGGGVSILWHNNRFDPRSARGYDDVYWRVVERAKTAGGLAGPAGELARRWRDQVDGDAGAPAAAQSAAAAAQSAAAAGEDAAAAGPPEAAP